MKEKIANFHLKGDGVIWTVFTFLCIFSIVEVFSGSSTLTFKGASYWTPVIKHVGLLLMGCACMMLMLNIPCRYFKLFTPFALFFSLITLVIVYFVGESTNGAQRWIAIAGIQFQPSELAKAAVILAEAQILSGMQTINGADKRAFSYVGILSLIYISLIALENLSTAMLLAIVVFLMMIIGRVPARYLWKTALVVVVAGVLAVTAVLTLGKEKEKDPAAQKKAEVTVLTDANVKQDQEKESRDMFHRLGTWKGRIRKFFEPLPKPEEFDIDHDSQVAHSHIAIASSNGIGKGPGNSVERDFLAQAYSDFIFAIIIEETGIIGGCIVLFLYIVLLFRTATIANKCANSFPALLIMGIALLLVIQALFNMAVAVGLAPVTGQPLPLVSKGGTSTIMNCIYIGIILSVSHSAKKREEEEPAKA